LTSAAPGSAQARAESPVGSDTLTQLLNSATGAILTGADQPGAPALLTPAEVAATTRQGQLQLDHDDAARVGPLTGPVRILAAPTHSGTAVVAVGTSLAGRDAAVADLAGELAVALPLVLLVSIAGAYLIAAASLRPVEQMRARAARIRVNDPHPRLPAPPAADEISRLAATLNDLLTRLHDALARERQFVADASHELRTPLSLLTTELELALRRPRAPYELIAALRSASEETERLSRLAQDLLLLARLDQPDADTAPRPPVVTELRPLLQTLITRYHHTTEVTALTLDCAPGLAVRADPHDCARAVSNLIDNALQHACPPIDIGVRPATAPGLPHAVAIEVRDHGPGFAVEFLARAFDRFTQADPARSRGGTGLGLAITAALVARHGGRVAATNYPDGGAGLTLTLPAAAAPIAPAR
jgi:signal transduction histidine kinase